MGHPAVVPGRVAMIALAVALATAPARADEGPELPIESRPYAIRAFVAFDPTTRVDARGRDRIVDAWLGLVRRMVGPAWEVRVESSDASASARDPGALRAEDVKPLGAGFDKVWMIRGEGRADGGGFLLRGREFDVATGSFGAPHERPAPFAMDAARELFRLTETMFAPYAEIGEAVGDAVPLRVRGAGLPRGQLGQGVAPPGTVFRPLRIFYNPDDSILNVQLVPYSYLVVASRDGASTTATLVRGVADPLSKRFPRKNKLIALGVKPGAFPTRFRFVRQKDQAPASGYVLTARPAPDGPTRDVATTDREGRVALPRGFADGLVIVRLVAGRAEPLREVPVMPGESDEELTIPVDPKEEAVALETQLDALRDEIVDLVAVRGRLERRMKAREQGDDWAGVEAALVEFRKLPPRDGFARRLKELEDAAARQEQRTRSVVLTRTARAQLAETQSLIGRYLDDELYRSYEDAVLRAKQRDSREEAKAKAKGKSPVLVAPAPTAAPPAKPAPAAKAVAPAGVTPF